MDARLPRPPGRAEIAADLSEHGLAPSRALGQNFLADPNTADRIARLARVGPGDHVLEIGAGLGSLTIALAATGASVLALEIDRHLVPLLRARVEPAGVAVVEGDAMSCDFGELLAGAVDGAGAGDDSAGWIVVANLPYNIATPLVLGLLESVPVITRMIVMVQKEVGERFSASPRTKAYGAVSVRVAYFARAGEVGRVGAGVFLPRPNVESVLVELRRLEEPPVDPALATYDEINRLLTAGFATRRKMLRRSLAGIVSPEAFEAAGVDSALRPEELDVVAWGRLAAAVRSP